MMKWLRKHSKQIMVVVVLLAMFSFVGGQALQSIASPKPGREPYAKAFGAVVTYGDLQPARGDAAVLEHLGIAWQYDPLREMNTTDWYLLSAEAERAGIRVSDQEVTESLQRWLQAFQQRGGAGDILDILRSRYRITPIDVRQALHRHLTILKNWSRVESVAAPAEQEVRHFVRDTEEKVRVKFVCLDAEKFVEPGEPVAAEELKAQFEQYRDVGRGEGEMGFGYRHPQRVRLQHVMAPVQKIEPHIAVTLEEAKTHWKKNKHKYTKVEYLDDPGAASSPASQAASQSSQPTPPKKIRKETEKTFTEAKPDVERELRKAKATQQAEQAMRTIAKELAKPWEDEKTDPQTGYKAIPEPVRDPNHMKVICDRVSKDFGIPLEYAETALVSKEELAAMPGLRSVTVEGEGADGMGQSQQMSLADYAFRVPAFLPKAVGRDSGLCLQQYQAPDVPLQGSGFDIEDGRIVQSTTIALFRVIEARQAEAPAGSEEVRQQVEQDIRLRRAFERIEPAAKDFYAVAKHLGTQVGLELFEDLRTKRGVASPVSPSAFARRVSLSTRAATRYLEALQSGESTLVAPTVPMAGDSEEFVDACFAMAQDEWQPQPTELPNTERTQAATTRPAASPAPVVQLLSVPKLKKWFVIELLSIDRVDPGRYESELRGSAYSKLEQERALALRLNWYKPENIAARCGFEFIERPEPAAPRGEVEEREPPEPEEY